MADYDNTNRGTLFVEEDKKNERGPDYTGTLNVEGKEWRIAGWRKETKSGRRIISLNVSEPQSKGGGSSSKPSSNDAGW